MQSLTQSRLSLTVGLPIREDVGTASEIPSFVYGRCFSSAGMLNQPPIVRRVSKCRHIVGLELCWPHIREASRIPMPSILIALRSTFAGWQPVKWSPSPRAVQRRVLLETGSRHRSAVLPASGPREARPTWHRGYSKPGGRSYRTGRCWPACSTRG